MGDKGPDEKSKSQLIPETGATKDGVPLSFNRAPAPDLEPWLGRIMVAVAAAPDDSVGDGLLCNDAGYVRTAIGVDWTVETADGTLEIRDETFVCGQHSKAMPLRFKGGIKVAGFMLRPGAMRALWGADDGKLIDRIKPMEFVGLADEEITSLHIPGISPEDWLLAIEDWLRLTIARKGLAPPEDLSQRFEVASFADPNQSITDFADENNVTARTLQRVIKRDFGLTPKQVMRRARTLDLAARLCGVADENEEEDIYLRFFDQSHQIREFIAFFGMTPKQFMKDRQGLLTLSLEIRQARRLELLNRVDPDAVRPWMHDPLLPAAGEMPVSHR
ncbi:helix-turn-helix domain-containing protein [Pontixanthobacter aestiaquae]|uniref:Helix-turn-helix domain-containing protein n=1 Tax=Pontixanthobacter aestiaquae TaxID=1509367 RepID=A0A844Z3X6_9SPHN|nr:helix-turn-helix domain-containing protein [Pontixanthobacter aestiaquae]MDN3647046.1 helix-turn-helix domain-containing protein [Pontixanthobacter aestiaquae]MXO81976.1 helix-turn-helix domain-containing protein [Pontixanthobacter aestiaquae]